jgi:cold shock CspA family protein
MEVIQIGTLKYWNRERLFGVLRAQDGVEYFIHIDKVLEGYPNVGCNVEFVVGPPSMRGKKARPLLPALQVKFSPKITPSLIKTLSTPVVQS